MDEKKLLEILKNQPVFQKGQHQNKPSFIFWGNPGSNIKKIAQEFANTNKLELVTPLSIINDILEDKQNPYNEEVSKKLYLGDEIDYETLKKLIKAQLQSDKVWFKGFVLQGLPLDVTKIEEEINFLKEIILYPYKNQNLIFVNLHSFINDIKRNVYKELIDPITGIVYSGDQIVYTQGYLESKKKKKKESDDEDSEDDDEEEEEEEEEEEDEDNDENSSEISEVQYSEYSSVDSDESYDSDRNESGSEYDEEEENFEEEESDEESDGEEKKTIRKYGIESKLSLIDSKIYSRLMKRPENEVKVLDKFFKDYDKYDIEIKKILQEYFTVNNVIDIDGSQPIENILHCLQKKVTVQGHFQYGRNVLPERVVITNQSILEDTNEDNQIDYILAQEPDTEVEMPKRELSVWGKYCCVTYTETKELVFGSPAFSAMYKNNLYLFASEDALLKFMKNPILYFQCEPISPITKICIIGPRYSGQSTIAKLIAKQYNLLNINMEKILRLINISPSPNESTEDLGISMEDSLLQKIKESCDQGLEVTGEMMVDIIKLALKKTEEDNKYRGWIIDGFPSTSEQAQLLIEENLIPDTVIFLRYDIQIEDIMERLSNIKVNALTGTEWNSNIRSNLKSPRKVSLKLPEHYKIQECPFIDEAFESYKKEEVEILNLLNENNIPQTIIESERDIPSIFSQVRSEIDQFFPRASQNVLNSENVEYGCTKDYCPVMLKKNNVLVKSSNTHSLEYQKRIYNFSSDETKTDFMANPFEYIGHTLPKPSPPRILVAGISGSGKTTIFKNIPIEKVHYIEFKKFVKEVYVPTLPPEEQDECFNSIFESFDSIDTNPNVENYIMNIMKILYTEEPYVTDGFILENFPRTQSEAQTLVKNNYVFDMIISLKIEPDEAVERLLPAKIKMEEEKFKQRSKEGSKESSEDDDDSEKDEFPEDPEEFFSDELNEECEKESTRISDMVSSYENYTLTPVNEVEAGRCLRPIIYEIKRLLRPYIQCHESLLTHTIPIDVPTAELYLEKGIKKLSKFGKTCPVTLERNKYQNKKTIGRLPVIYNDYIIFLRNKSCQKEFERNTYYYMNQPDPEPIVKPQIIVTGLPMSGKTTLSFDLAKRLHAEYITIPKIIQDLVDANEQTELVQMISKILYSGNELPDELIVKALKISLLRTRCVGRGWVLDNFPLNVNQAELMIKYDIIPQLVVEIKIKEEEMYARGINFVKEKTREDLYTINVPDGLDIRSINYVQNFDDIKKIFNEGYNNWLTIDGLKSKWAIKEMIYNTVVDYSLKEQNYLNQKNKKHAAPIYNVHVNTELINRNIGKFREYCPVCFIDNEELILGDPGTQYVAEYQNKFYRMAGQAELDTFISNPERYANAPRDLPEILPKRLYITSLKSIFPRSFELKGYCPVTFAEGSPNNFESIVVGDIKYVAEYDNKLYCMANEEQLKKFMKTPWKYINYILPKKLPPKKIDISISKLPMIGYMEQTLSNILYKSIDALGKQRPVYPYKSLEFSAARFIGLYLKANNENASKFSREVYEKKLNRFIEDCELTKQVYQSVKDRLKMDKEESFIPPNEREEGLDEKVDHIIALKN